ncbi:hypothetical protein NHX12_032114 [Muraenolepis orangiensis]|uniref:AIG1-type G domain-containing protein n=1 Tax=Muraenolepis orangiensis TaxID=630683 RepID=A0A9Q0E8B4_9TELE|nr:hypothetical protein NHX12_032114 [Muraenolepis orangiensis]
MASSSEHLQPEPELRLVLLGRTGAGQSSAGDAILGGRAFRPAADAGAAARCEKLRGRVGGRQVAVVTVPDWFSSRSAPPEEARALFSSLVALSSPGPHAFLLCVPAHRPSDGEERALAALELILGPSAVTAHTLVLFTHGEEEEEEEDKEEEKEEQEEQGKKQTLEELLSTKRRDLLELVETCEGRYHVFRGFGGGGGGGGEEEEEEEKERKEKWRRKSVQELLEKVKQAVGECEDDFFTCDLYKEAEERVRERQEQLARERRERSGGEEEGPDDNKAEKKES